MKRRILLITLLSTIVLTGCGKETKKEESKIVENNGMLSYTIDGEKTDIKPTKEEGYIVNKIICDNGSDMMWDNDNWEVELTNIVSKDRCKVDFTKDTSKEGYRVTVKSNMTNALDSSSKATIENGTVIIYSKSKIENLTGCSGIIDENKVIVSNVISNQTCNIVVEDKTLAGIIKTAYPPQPGRTDFSTIYDGTPALYTGSDDQGTTYYFSGDGTNMRNWVSFAGKMWRIIRINGNGSVRLLYSGTNGIDAADLGKSAYNSNLDHPVYVGWKYSIGGSLDANRGNGTVSTMYTFINSNFYSKLSSTHKNYIDTNAIYCNDRNILGGAYTANSDIYFEPSTRLAAKKEPKFTCHTSDQFKDGFGLMTADEVVAAGGLFKTNSPKAYYYLAKDGSSSITGSDWWWTMSPSNFRNSNKFVHVFYVGGHDSVAGYLYAVEVNASSGAVRPVISLKKEVIVTSGDGSANFPYEVSL